mmetsp:Transcript_21706/g.40527  ORF Transcript_21706/g.40527 Transcript_21706/m.40527 type:complete len:523 (-) Transcript_21706:353-1921(-)|eukprot:CAMPEP_0197432650 /NCGR_PEP_ID=MMETSP1175-20131217/688_1 /TAXON_ID=1003142 /ORGANISM="Triceratium dubium, Strain CCMP147" /LENGTH=522 /DNA_ID=CAMNT_0042960799 /DNA_START=241 /DNA_END=1809 /DNA_ORIENTATION=+
MIFATVSDPETDGTQTKFLVTVHRTDDTGSSCVEPEKNKVYHRYSEFQWLYERLIKERRGAIIPIAGLRFGIASKAGVGQLGAGNADDTVMGRCRRLDAFMRSASANPELQDAPSLEAFLAHGTGEDFDAAKVKVEQGEDEDNPSDDEVGDRAGEDDDGSAATSPPPKGSSKPKRTGFRQFVAKTVVKTATAVAAKGGKTKLHEAKDEERIRILEQYVKDLEVQLKSMADQASILNRSGKEGAAAWTEFGRAAGVWEEVLKSRRQMEGTGGPKLMSEGKNSIRGSVSVSVTDEDAVEADPSVDSTCAKLGTIDGLSIKTAVKLGEGVKREKEEFTDIVLDLYALVMAIKVALHKRFNCQLTCTSRLQQASKASAQSSAGEKEIEKAEKDAEEAKEDLEQATKRFLREMERVDAELDKKLGCALASYARIQLEQAKNMQEVWMEMLKMGTAPAANGGNDFPAANGDDNSEQNKEEEDSSEKARDEPLPYDEKQSSMKGTWEEQLPPAPAASPPPEPSAPPLED